MIEMKQLTLGKLNGESDLTEYFCSREHLKDELKRLDQMLLLHILSHNSYMSDNPLDQLKGLVISREEITGLLEEPHFLLSDQAKVKELSEELKRLSEIIEMKRSRSLKKDIYLAIDALSKMFGLNRMEEQCIIICLAIEVDSKYEKLYGYIQDDITKKKPTVDMVLRLLCGSFEDRLEARHIFKRESPLLKFLIGINEGSYGQTPLISQELKLHNRIVDFLLGHNYIDDKLVDFTFSSGLTETVEKPNYRTSANFLRRSVYITCFLKSYFIFLKLDCCSSNYSYIIIL